jgi:hypothetical protein
VSSRSGFGRGDRWGECLEFVVGLAGLRAVVEAADEPVEHVAQGGGVAVSVFAAAVVQGAGPGECAAAVNAERKPVAASRLIETAGPLSYAALVFLLEDVAFC